MAVPILKQGHYLIASIQGALSDTEVIELRDDVLDEITQLYFERRRVLAQLQALPDPGDAERLRLRLRDDHGNNLGIAHGGVICTLLDIAMGTAARLSAGRPVLTLDMQTRFLAPGRGVLLAEGFVVRGGRSVLFCEAQIRGEDGGLIATASGLFKPAGRDEQAPGSRVNA